jgi:nucleoside-diphosphate kinase
MAIERTLSIIKPDGVAKNLIGDIYTMFEEAGLQIVASRMVRLTREMAEFFYLEHKGKDFFDSHIDFMCSGPVVVQVLEGKNAIAKNREIMGATNPFDAKYSTIRSKWGEDLPMNVVHGSENWMMALSEIAYFFRRDEIYPRKELA